MARLSISLFGSYRVTLDGTPLCDFDSDKTRLLLAYLVVEADKPHRREQLAGMFWPEQADAHARRSLNQAIYILRKILGEHGGTGELGRPAVSQIDGTFLLSDALTVQFNPHSSFMLDIHIFTDLLAACQAHSHRHLEACPECIQRLSQVNALYSGDFLAGLALKDSVAFEEWALVQREHFHRKGLEAMQALALSYEYRGDLPEALQVARRQAEIDPLWESGQRQLMRILALTAQPGQAVAQYERLRHWLASELEVPPERETQMLMKQVSQDLSVKTALNPLPVPAFPLIGRKQELAELRAYLHDPSCRLLTILGSGGTGKTRLALEIARALQYSFPDGVYLISLSAMDAHQSFTPVVAEALGFSFHEQGDPSQQLLDFLRHKNLLLVMDSFEAVLPGSSWVSEVLRTAPGVRFLVTSRASLKTSEEQVYTLEGMPVPWPGRLELAEQFDSVQLFRIFAQHRRPAFRLDEHTLPGVVSICRVLQGIPLGLLLASSWVGSYSLEDIAEQIEQKLDFLEVDWSDIPARQRSLQATFYYSWYLLSEEEQHFFTALAVFNGSFSMPAIKRVAGTSIRLLQSLVDKCLVSRTATGRYQIHDLVHKFASQHLDEDLEYAGEIRTRYSRFYLEALVDWGKGLKSARQRETLEEMELELENLRAAWRWAVTAHDWQGIEGALDGMGWYADLRFRFQEGERACRTALEELDQAGASMPVKLRLLTWQSRFLYKLGQRETAQHSLSRCGACIEECRTLGWDIRRETAGWLSAQAEAQYYSDRNAASSFYRQSLELFKNLQDEWEIGSALMSLGELVHHSGNFIEARELLSQALEFLRRVGEPGRIAHALRWLAFNEVRLGRLGEAEQILRQSVELRRASGSPLDVAQANDDLGTLIAWSGKYKEGAALLEDSLAVYKELGYQSKETWTHGVLGLLYLLQSCYPQARVHAEQVLKLAISSNAVRETALGHYVLGCISLGEGNFQPAYVSLSEAVRFYRQVDQKDELSWALIGTYFSLRRLGQRRQSLGYLGEALAVVRATHGFSAATQFIVAAAVEAYDRGDVPEALELYILAERFPNVSQANWYDDIAWKQIAPALADLPEGEAQAARMRGSQRDLFTTIEELSQKYSPASENDGVG